MGKRTKRRLSFLMAAVTCLALLVGINAYAPAEVKAKALTTGRCGASVNYSFDSKTGTLTISGKGSMMDFDANSRKSPFSGHEEILSVKIEDGVTSVGQWAFYDCFGLKSAELGKDVETVSEWAFYGCVGLADLTMQPDSVTSIGDGAFMHCLAMNEISVPDSLAYIGSQAFDDTGYYQNKSNWEDGRVLYIGSCLYTAFYNHIYTDPRYKSTTKPYSGGSGGGFIMSDERTLGGSYTIRTGTKFLAVGAFGSTGVTDVAIPKSMTEISSEAFAGSRLESITIPSGAKKIESGTFSGCHWLKSVKIPKSVTEIGDNAFFDCRALESITIPSGVAFIGDKAFSKTALRSISLPKTVKSVGNEAFYNCASLKKVTLKSGLRGIGEEAFGRTGIKSITVPKTVTIIGRHALGYNIDNKVKGFTIKGYKGSAAQTYAKENKFKFVTIKK